MVIDDEIVAELDAHFEDDLERSVRIEPGRWERRPDLAATAERVSPRSAGCSDSDSFARQSSPAVRRR